MSTTLEGVFHMQEVDNFLFITNTLQFVILSKINGLNNNTIENALGERPSTSNILEAPLANKSSSKLLNLGMEFMLNAENL